VYPTTQRNISEDVLNLYFGVSSTFPFESAALHVPVPDCFHTLTQLQQTVSLLTVSARCLWAPLLLDPNCWAAAPVGPGAPSSAGFDTDLRKQQGMGL